MIPFYLNTGFIFKLLDFSLFFPTSNGYDSKFSRVCNSLISAIMNCSFEILDNIDLGRFSEISDSLFFVDFFFSFFFRTGEIYLLYIDKWLVSSVFVLSPLLSVNFLCNLLFLLNYTQSTHLFRLLSFTTTSRRSYLRWK